MSYDGGKLPYYFRASESLDDYEVMRAALEAAGFYAQEITGVLSVIYPIVPLTAAERAALSTP